MNRKITCLSVFILTLAISSLPVTGMLNGIDEKNNTAVIYDDFMLPGENQPIPYTDLDVDIVDFFPASQHISRDNLPVPEYEFITYPSNIMTSYYDYMPGSYSSHPIRLQTEHGDGVYLTFFGQQSSSSTTRRQYWGYVNNEGSIQDWGLITDYDIRQGYGGIGIHPATGNCIASWHEDNDEDGKTETMITFDDYDAAETPGIWQEPLFIDDDDPNEYIWPSIQVGPSPLGEGYVRVYQLANNYYNLPSGTPCEDVRLMFIDVENNNGINLSSVLDSGNWNTRKIFSFWRPKSVRPFQSFAIDHSNPGHVAFIGNAVWLEGDLGGMPVDEGAFVWESFDYGESWTPENIHSDGPESFYYNVNNPGFEGMPSELEVSAIGYHNTAVFDSEGKIHWTYLQSYGYTDTSGAIYYLPYFLPQAEMVWDGYSFSFHEVPELPGIDPLSGHSVPWTDIDHLYPTITWSTYPSSDAGIFHENTQKQAINVERNWMVQMWVDGTYHQLADDDVPGYEDYFTHPLVFLSISNDNGNTWSEPIELTDVNSPLFDFSDQRTVYPYICDNIVDLGDNWGQIFLYYMDDNYWGSSVHGSGPTNGGQILYSSLKIEFPEPGDLLVDAHGPYEGYIGGEVQFLGGATGGLAPYNWSWDFGNGDISYEKNPKYNYTVPDVYTVTLTVTDSTEPPNTAVDVTTATIVEDTTPPETNCTLTGDMEDGIYIDDVTVNLDATDDISGVESTWVKVDTGSWVEYTGSFIVSELGEHVISYYSVDYAGNEEDEKATQFTICPIRIELVSGTGVTAVVRTIGDQPLTNVSWTIHIEGGLFIIPRDGNGTLDLELDDETELNMKLFGIGLGIIKDLPIITVNVGCAETSATAKILFSKVYIQ